LPTKPASNDQNEKKHFSDDNQPPPQKNVPSKEREKDNELGKMATIMVVGTIMAAGIIGYAIYKKKKKTIIIFKKF